MNAMIHCDGTLCLININDRGENDPPIHFAVKDGTKPLVCDNCSLQWCCDELFGVKGKNCKLVCKGMRWHAINREQASFIRAIL